MTFLVNDTTLLLIPIKSRVYYYYYYYYISVHLHSAVFQYTLLFSNITT